MSEERGDNTNDGTGGSDSQGGKREYGFLRRKREREERAKRDAGSGESGGDSSNGIGGIADTGNSETGSSGGETGEPEKPVDGSSELPIENRGSDEGNPSSAPDDGRIGGDSGRVVEFGRGSGRRGRHPKDCQCPRHRDGGIGEGTQARSDASRIPRDVSWNELFGIFGITDAEDAKRPPRLDDALAGFWKLSFDLVSFRAGEHWKLTKEEAKQLGKCAAVCLNTIPAVSKSRAMKNFQNMLPWIALVMTAVVIVYPRYLITKKIQEIQKEREEKTNGSNASERVQGKVYGASGKQATGQSEKYTDFSGATHERISFPDKRSS